MAFSNRMYPVQTKFWFDLVLPVPRDSKRQLQLEAFNPSYLRCAKGHKLRKKRDHNQWLYSASCSKIHVDNTFCFKVQDLKTHTFDLRYKPLKQTWARSIKIFKQTKFILIPLPRRAASIYSTSELVLNFIQKRINSLRNKFHILRGT